MAAIATAGGVGLRMGDETGVFVLMRRLVFTLTIHWRKTELASAKLVGDGQMFRATRGRELIFGGKVVQAQCAHIPVVIARVVLAVLDAAEEPAHTTAKGLDVIPGIGRVNESPESQRSTRRRAVRILPGGEQIGLPLVGVGIVRPLGAGHVRRVRVGPKMQDRKDDHLDAEQRGGNGDFDVRVRDDRVRFEDLESLARRNRNGGNLPKGEEDNELNGKNLQKQSLAVEGHLELNVALNNAVHGDEDGNAVDRQYLNVVQSRTVRT